MRLEDDPDAAAWVEGLGDPDDFDWDAGNRTKNRKHGVEAEEIESILAAPLVFAGRIVEPAHDEPRWLALGRTAEGRLVALVFTRRGERLRPISCRSMRKDEREVYREALEEGEEAPGQEGDG